MFDENYLAKYSSKFAIIFLRTHTDIRPYNKIKEYFVMTLGEFPGMIQIFRRTLTTHNQHAQKILKYMYTVIPRLTRFPIARIPITRIFEAVKQYLHSTVLYISIQ